VFASGGSGGPGRPPENPGPSVEHAACPAHFSVRRRGGDLDGRGGQPPRAKNGLMGVRRARSARVDASSRRPPRCRSSSAR